ncbi:hypothetical protein IC762_18320 [Bradyrhizobium genosp. L]|uniref:hypothetical protein n=1 Tax=Bradyrhizobium genosp. L TaxID=83637 RepID=UPI0018A252C4|nr:hypothetical protein [Bradyrhizobium genosp. L]QPF81773.1 hypothetical protein IC762_18320 [Bradyrhizobium genosp. L]
MKKILITTAALMMCGSAFAQGTTGPGNQSDNMKKPGMTSGTMEKGSMQKGSMDNGTTGMNSGASKGMTKPDASGQGGSGMGSDQGGTKVAPK